MNKQLAILGIRGIPATHGGFETFAEDLAPYLVTRGWQVTVYCQEDGDRATYETMWKGVRLVHISVKRGGALGTIIFDWKSTLHAIKEPSLKLILGYNTAIFSTLYRLCGITSIMNMDGFEYRRAKWGPCAKAWLFLNERLGCWLGQHLIADHPEIGVHLATRVSSKKISIIPYGADSVTEADAAVLEPWGLTPRNYAVVIARPEPENSTLEIISAFSRKKRGKQLVVLGEFDPKSNPYHARVIACASSEVKFLGAIFDKPIVNALRFHAQAYVHGHQVGGTNPSLVESLGAGSAIIARDNQFNRWVADQAGMYFADEAECETLFDRLLDDDSAIDHLRLAARKQFVTCFTWSAVRDQYEDMLGNWVAAAAQAGIKNNAVAKADPASGH